MAVSMHFSRHVCPVNGGILEFARRSKSGASLIQINVVLETPA